MAGRDPHVGEQTLMRKILVVEDSKMMQALYKQVLAPLDCRVVMVGNGQAALDHLAAEGDPDVVVLDINMPVMDGLESLAHYLGGEGGSRPGGGSPQAKKARVVVVSTEAQPDDQRRAMEAGASGYLPKPFTPDALQALLRKLLAEDSAPGAGA